MADLRVNGFVHYEALDSLRPTLDNTGGQPPTEVIMSRRTYPEQISRLGGKFERWQYWNMMTKQHNDYWLFM
jgi:hypothetical protein